MTGKRYGSLLVVKRVDPPPEAGLYIRQHAHWLCVCDCGNEKVIPGRHMRKNGVRTCGHDLSERRSAARRDHGLTYTVEWYTWSGMSARCYNPNSASYGRYGGRGIRVCDRWRGKNGFRNFYEDMGKRPSDKHSINRIDNDGNYTLKNCEWATDTEQANNKSSNRRLTLGDETHTLTEWARIKSTKPHVFYNRLNAGWSVEKTLTTPARVNVMNRRLTADEVREIKAWLRDNPAKKDVDIAGVYGVSIDTIANVRTGKAWDHVVVEGFTPHRKIPVFSGENNPRAKMNWAKVREVRARAAQGEKVSDLAEEFKVGRWIISDIVNLRTWKEAR